VNDGSSIVCRRRIVQAGWMAESACTGFCHQAGVGIGGDVLDHLVEGAEGWHSATMEQIANLPGNDVIGSRSVARNANRSHLVSAVVKGESSSKDINSANAHTD
jgi:hypothetical protein